MINKKTFFDLIKVDIFTFLDNLNLRKNMDFLGKKLE